MAKKTSGLLDAVLAEPPQMTGPKSWFVRMADGDAKSQLRELHAAYHAGKLEKYSVSHLFRMARDLLSLQVGVSGFENWLKKADPDA
jgi:hypothetical protein